MQTKYIITHKAGFHLFIPKDPADVSSRGFNSPIRLDYLEDIGYRIYYANETSEFFTELCNRIKDHKYVYPPYLGHANLHAKIEYCFELDFTQLSSGSHKINSLIPVSALDESKMKIFDGLFSIVHKIPMVMETKASINNIYPFPTLIRTENIIFPEKVNDTISIYLNDKAEIYSVDYQGEIKKIVMLPSNSNNIK